MALNLQFSPEPSLQEGFLDKSTGLPLSFGLVFFYSDVNRTTLKPIYTLSGSPPNYSYTQLPNPVILSGIGTIQDGNGNDVIPYFYPFDANGNTELYYIVVTDQFGVQQFTRQGFPNVGSNVTPINTINFSENFIPNGQFLLWNPPASYPSTKYTFNFGGTIGSTDVIDVAPGGWTFQVTAGSTTTYTIKFNQLLAAVLTPPASPRYEIEIIRSSPTGSDNICDLRIRFMDVNKFQSTGTNDTWTLLFNAESVSTLNNVTIHLIKYFGTTDSSSTPTDTTEDIVWGGPINISTSQQTFALANSFGVNTGKSIGNNNNDFLEFAIRFPASASQTFDVKLTDFVLVNQNITQTQASSFDFPATTNGEFVLQALSNLAPTTTSDTTTNYYQEDGSNLYLPIVMTQRGFTYDYSEIGNIEAKTTLTDFNSTSISTTGNELICDGAQYKVSDYSPLGIPYRRLFNKIFNTARLTSEWGSGANFVNAAVYTVDLPTLLFLFTNKPGAQTAAADGSNPTGFTFASNNTGAATIDLTARTNTNGRILIRGNVVGTALAAPVDGTGGQIPFTVFTNFSATNYVVYFFPAGATTGASLSAGGGNPAMYISVSNTTTQYSFWFDVAGEVANGPGTRIKVSIDSTFKVSEIAAVLTNAINRYQTEFITTVAAAAIPANAFFTFHANGVTYSPWYNKGSGTAPSSPNPIEVSILPADTAATVNDKTLIAINSQFFAVPDLRGLFLRGRDPNQLYDDKSLERVSNIYNINATDNNTFEIDTFGLHVHPPLSPATGFTGDGAGGGLLNPAGARGDVSTTGATGYYETRPVNSSITWVIKY